MSQLFLKEKAPDETISDCMLENVSLLHTIFMFFNVTLKEIRKSCQRLSPYYVLDEK